jgi:hypothetical protein
MWSRTLFVADHARALDAWRRASQSSSCFCLGLLHDARRANISAISRIENRPPAGRRGDAPMPAPPVTTMVLGSAQAWILTDACRYAEAAAT